MMKLTLWNIGGAFPLISRTQEWSRDSYDEENISAFAEVLQKEQADIVSLQEIHSEDDTNSEQLKLLRKSLTMQATPLYTYGNSHIKEGSRLAMGILSKFPIISTVVIQTPNPNLKIERSNGETWISLDCGFVVSQIEYKNQTINIVDGHLVPYHYFKRDFSEKAFDHIRKAIADILVPLADKPTIIAGDFNFDELQKLVPGLFPTYTEVFHQETTPTKGQQDHILVSTHWNVLEYEVRKSISDHFLCSVIAELK